MLCCQYKNFKVNLLHEHIPVRHALILSSYSVASLALSNLLKGQASGLAKAYIYDP